MNVHTLGFDWGRILEPITAGQGRINQAAGSRSSGEGEQLNAWENEGGSLHLNRPPRMGVTKERLLAELGVMLILGGLLFAFVSALQ